MRNIFFVNKQTLIRLTGVLWLFAAYMLSHRAYVWSEQLTAKQIIIGGLIAVPIGLIKARFVFYKLNYNNILRIVKIPKAKVSLWQFHILRDKLIIVFMIVGGILLRRSQWVDPVYLMPIYAGIGLAMFFVVYLYFSYNLKTNRWMLNFEFWILDVNLSRR